MKISILAVGRRPQGWIREAEADFSGRIQPFCELDMKLAQPEDESRGIERAREIESQRLAEKMPTGAKILACDPAGEPMSSPQLAELIRASRDHAEPLVFLIGGSHGIAPELAARAQRKISFGRITLPHELFRVVLLEQMYRGFQILTGSKYHK